VRTGWADDALELTVEVAVDGVPRLTRLAPGRRRATRPAGESAPAAGALPERPGQPERPGLPLADVVVAGSGRSWSGSRYAESVAGQQLRYRGHAERGDGLWREIRIDLADAGTGLRAAVSYRILAGHGVVRAQVELTNGGSRPVTIQSVTSFLAACFPAAGAAGPNAGPASDPGPGASGGPDRLADLELYWARNDWLAESRWQRRPVRDLLPDLNRAAHGGARPRGRAGLTSAGTWSSAQYLPMGAVVDTATGQAWAWQIEHNGPWHWQVGETGGGLYVALLGPTDTEHDWRRRLAPGESVTTVPVSVAVSADGFEGAIGALTAGRRAARRPHDDHRRLPVIFNDYMNTLRGDPSTAALLPLIDTAAATGAEYFVIDAGWYAEAGEPWWDAVGEWQPSASRFPGGLTEVLDRIRAAGMVPGLWLEPEVVGVRSPVAGRLPDGAFFTRGGERVVEHSRYHLDLRHPAARAHLDAVVDRLAGDLGIGYLKLDYNINGGPGTDAGGLSAGAGLLEHNRAHLRWLDGVLDRHPALTIENCGSGGMRADYAMLARCQLQSTSDQQDFRRYPPIAAAAAAAITPEQAAVWAYPQPEFTDDEITFTMCGALLGRIHLSGHLDRMTPQQLDLVATAVRRYKDIRGDLPAAVPFWPLGLPEWDAPVLAAGLRAPAATYLVVWRRGRTGTNGLVTLPIAHPGGTTPAAEILYPAPAPGAAVRWAGETLTVDLPRTPSACLIRLC
jgi:alpha-galactosidase